MTTPRRTRAARCRVRRRITFFDTSNAYRAGYGEQVLGKALADVRDQIVIARKFGYDLDATDGRRGQQERPRRTDVASVRADLDASPTLRQLHNPRMTHLGQAALRWILVNDLVATTLPNIYDRDQLDEFTGAADAPGLTNDEVARRAAVTSTTSA